MILDPDFIDHWKTQLLVSLLDGDQCAPIYVIRLWSHCQNRKKWVFTGMPDGAVAGICRYHGNAQKLVDAMLESGYMHRDDDGSLVATGWEEKNAQLIAAWENGKRGGRPKKKAKTPRKRKKKETQVVDEAGVCDEKTHGLTDKIREDEIREDLEPPLTPPVGGGEEEPNPEPEPEPKAKPKPKTLTIDEITFPPRFDTPAVRESVEEWLQHHRDIRKPYKSPVQIHKLFNEYDRDGPETFIAAVNYSIAMNYQGVHKPKDAKPTQQNKRSAFDEVRRRLG